MSFLPAFPTAPAFTGIELSPKTNAGQRSFTDGVFKSYAFHMATPKPGAPQGVTGIEKKIERKLQIIDRALIDGADVHDFGRKARTFSADIVFFGANYLNEFYNFLDICNDGKAGKLILPDQPEAVLAYFQTMSVKSSAADGETFSVSCTWIEAASTDTPRVKEDQLSLLQSQLETATAKQKSVAQKIQDVVNAVNNNVFLKALEQAPKAASQLQVFVESALNYPSSLKAQVVAYQANLIATTTIAQSIVNSIATFVFGKSGNTSSAATSAAANLPTTIDPDTGQQVTDFTSPDVTVTVADPLAAPSVVPTVSKTAPDVNTDTGALSALSSVISDLKSSSAGLQSSSNGRTSDVMGPVAALVNELKDLANAIRPAPLVAYLTPIDLSLGEIAFFHSISVDQVDQLYRNNTHLDDPMVIPAGSVVYL